MAITPQDEFQMVLRLALALMLGALVGLEREFRGHEAGIRTASLICLGAAIFGEISFSTPDDRVAAGVVQGVGFLGAGLIYVRKGAPAGVTTAATTWVLAGVGLLVSSRYMVTATVLTGMIILLLEMAPISDWVYHRGRAMRRARGQREPDTGHDDYEPETEIDSEEGTDIPLDEPISTKNT